MPQIIGKAQTVVDHDGLKIDEYAGNIGSSSDRISIALVTITKPTSEPWLTLDYDEWMCVTKGRLSLHYQEDETTEEGVVTTCDKVMEVKCNETVFIKKGERFRPVFPDGDTQYIPVCLPAFRPDRCRREEGEEDGAGDVSKNLEILHETTATATTTTDVAVESSPTTDGVSDVLYHMCQKTLWEEATKSKKAYFPPTFTKDGGFTHATNVPKRLIETANHFYTKTEGSWICLQLSRSALTNVGIITIDEGSLPVGQTKVSDTWVESQWICPHIYGGVPTLECLGVLTQIRDMTRDEDGNFLNIVGLTD